MDRVERMEWALRLMCASGKCEHTTSGIGDCFRSGRAADAKYGADRACVACIADYALNGHVRGTTINAKANRMGKP